MQVGGGEHTANALLEQFNFGLDPPPPQGFPLWSAWGHAAEQLLGRVTDDLACAVRVASRFPNHRAPTSTGII
jgi:hypothetical protein